MENVNAKAKNIAEETSGKIQLVYIHRKGIVAQDKKGNKIAFFQIGKSIEPLLHLPHEYGEGEHDPEFPNCTDTYSFFNEKFGFWVTKKDKSILWRMRTDISFVFEGHELIGMKFDDFLSLNLLQPDFIQKDYWYFMFDFSDDFAGSTHLSAYRDSWSGRAVIGRLDCRCRWLEFDSFF